MTNVYIIRQTVSRIMQFVQFLNCRSYYNNDDTIYFYKCSLLLQLYNNEINIQKSCTWSWATLRARRWYAFSRYQSKMQQWPQ